MKNIIPILLLSSFMIVFWSSCEEASKPEAEYQAAANNPEFLHRSMKRLTDIIVHNTFSPPVASRIYVYPSIAAYEVIRHQSDSIYESLDEQLTDLKNIPQPDPNKKYCYPLASVQAFLAVGKKLIFTEDSIQVFQEQLYKEFKAMGIPKSVFKNSIAYGDAVANHIIEWTKGDKYHETRSYSKYALSDDPQKWVPTPPDFMDGIEPHWRMIRPFAIDSAQQFKPELPTAYNESPSSQFYKETMVVHAKGRYYSDDAIAKLSEEMQENIAIAQFWDCNPYVSHHQGHVMYATKKITPGGHWVNISALAARKVKSNFEETSMTYALTTIALADGFISCWDEKYRSNLVRPETYINKVMKDSKWKPLLQTPPFPEYTSGHSVISSAASVALTSIYGDDFSFDDTSEEEYGLPMRSFKSFYGAANEAAISRLYGGIHYMPAITNGVSQGKALGEFVVKKVRLKK